MSYQVLARKWRPANFHEMVGQEHVKKALISALDADRLHHAYLFSGTRGVGKTTIARILSRCLNCLQGVSSNPCGQCAACTAIAEGRFVDLIEVDAASRTRIDDTRELLENVQYRPTEGRYKVYLIDEVHMLSTHSFNALLKTLEEPPSHVIFLLATTDPQKLPVTVLSRCLQFHLRHMSEDEISQHLDFILAQEHINFEPVALELIARAAQGSMRDALSLLDQGIAHGGGGVTELSIRQMLGSIDRAPIWDLIAALAAKNDEQVFLIAEKFAQFSADFEPVLAELIHALHELAVAQKISQYQSRLTDTARNLCEQIAAVDLQLYYQIALHGRRDLPLAPTSRMGFEMTLLRMLAFEQQSHQKKNEKITAPLATTPAEKTLAKTKISPSTAQPQASHFKQHSKLDGHSEKYRLQSTPGLTCSDIEVASAACVETSAPLAEPLAEPYDLSGEKKQASVQEKGSQVIQAKVPLKAIDAQNWPDIAENLNLQGMTRQLILHCHFVEFHQHPASPMLQLHCHNIPHQAINSQRIGQIAQAIERTTGHHLKVKIDSHNTHLAKGENARDVQLSKAEKRQQQAESSIANNEMVVDILKGFEAKIRPDSIQPIGEA